MATKKSHRSRSLLAPNVEAAYSTGKTILAISARSGCLIFLTVELHTSPQV